MLRIIILFTVIGLLVALSQCRLNNNTSEKVKRYYLERIAEADTAAQKFRNAVQGKATPDKLQSLFIEARLAYKKTEFLAEYYSPLTAKSINGAPIPDIDPDDSHIINEPEGFQVIEPMIFPGYDKRSKQALLLEANRLISNFARLKYVAETNSYTDEQVFDAIHLEVFRVITLGISGFDAPIAQNSMLEAKEALLSVSQVLKFYTPNATNTEALFGKAAAYLTANTDFNTFNRMQFIKEYANPLSLAIAKTAQTLNIKPINELRALNTKATSLFAADAFNANYFAPNIEAHMSKEKADLGRLLFFDPVLSGTGKRSCASCHQPEKGFSDGLPKNVTISKDKLVKRNTPTVLNAGFQSALFYDVRVSYLEDQATDVITNTDEMHGSLIEAVKKLRSSEEYSDLFKKAFPKDKDAINDYNLRNAISSYVRSLTSFNSRFDRYMRGETQQLSSNEVSGFNIYMGKAKCGTCHFAPLFNGVVPPDFSRTETEVIGVPVSSKINKVDTDPGKYNLRHIPLHKDAFRTPTLRNIALTAPYMHNGIYNTLDEVIDFYNDGGGSGLGIELENQTLPFENLKLTNKEKKDIIAFLNTLTDNEKAKDAPTELPALSASGKRRAVPNSY